MKKTLLITVVILAIFIVALFVLSQKAQNKKEIRIGALVPLTGNYATLGERIRNGMELAK